ncbi:hsp70 nucleotide exchange factor fes1 [Gaertneriomyces sp. JEL0708]|nr:hsp70 nucleotide exchange factor fes1 [Gaertneriomyces sp. JEL0708]
MSRPITQAELLQWSVLHTATANEDAPRREGPPVPREPIDAKWLDVILGKEHAVLMKECVETITTSSSNAEKRAAFERLEELVESLDNANDLEPLRLWAPIIDVLKNENEDEEIRMYAAWTLGTAVQNNPKAQAAFLRANGLEPLLSILRSTSSLSILNKALYTLSSTVRQNPTGFDQAVQLGVFNTLATVLRNGDTKLLTRTIFLIRALMEEEETPVSKKAAEECVENGLLGLIIDVIGHSATGDSADADLIEKGLCLLSVFGEKYPEMVTEEMGKQVRAVLIQLSSVESVEEALQHTKKVYA